MQPFREEEDSVSLYGSVNALWNAQPFRPPPALPLPKSSEGCARAQSITEGLDRIGHGTGLCGGRSYGANCRTLRDLLSSCSTYSAFGMEYVGT